MVNHISFPGLSIGPLAVHESFQIFGLTIHWYGVIIALGIVAAYLFCSHIAKDYGITSKKAASILDTFSCVFQAILPYGAQMLVALSASSALDIQISAFQVMPKLFYPYLLCVSSLVAIWCTKD